MFKQPRFLRAVVRRPFFAWLAVAGCLAGCQADEKTPAPEPKTTPVVARPTVSVTTAAYAPWPQVVPVQGSLMGDEQAVVGAKVAGRVKEVLVDLGSVVEKGQVLSRLDSEDFDLRVKQAEAQLTQARAALGLSPEEPDSQLDRLQSPPVRQEKALLDQAQFEYDRAQRLVQQKIVTVEEMQQKEAALNVAKARYSASLNGVDEKIALLSVRRAELALAKQQQTDAVTLAPFEGIVQQRHVAPGVYVSIGESIVTLVRTDPLRFHAGVPERQAMDVAVGQPMSIRIDGLDQEVQRQIIKLELETQELSDKTDGASKRRLKQIEKEIRELESKLTVDAKVTRISPALEMSSRTLVIEADVPNPNRALRSGVFAEAAIVVNSLESVLSIPEVAINEFAGVEKVWLVSDSVAEEHPIRTGRRHAGRVEVLEGLAEGDMIIADAEQGHTGQVAVVAAGATSAMRLGVGE